MTAAIIRLFPEPEEIELTDNQITTAVINNPAYIIKLFPKMRAEIIRFLIKNNSLHRLPRNGLMLVK